MANSATIAGMRTRARIKLEGVVQGIGFRPFCHRLSAEHRLAGFIANTSAGAEIEVEGSRSAILRFYRDLSRRLPPLARITQSSLLFIAAQGDTEFVIRESRKTGETVALVSPDIGTCDACRKELFDPKNRRYRYPFINCTDCGPRFSIITGVPYDRPLTTMREFAMCPLCRREYAAIADRRYHAQPNACPACGPRVTLLKGGKKIAERDTAMKQAARLLKNGKIIAIKGISGFHIACDARNAAAIKRLRQRKHRPSKPFAVMVADATVARSLCELSALEEQLLLSPERPIVLLRKKSSVRLGLLSPDNHYLGVMAPYSPLHYLLLADGPSVLVMTSANEADEPVETENTSALGKLETACDYFLVHDRAIINRCDDSIVQVIDGKAVVLRRGRGYSPFPFLLKENLRPTLACGAELKSTFCLAKGKHAFLSQYIGDLKTLASFSFYKEAARKLEKLFAVKPRLIACDLHPDYLSTRYARERTSTGPASEPGDPSCARCGSWKRPRLIPIQHHEAHVASVIAEHAIAGAVIGVCFDGIGLGYDQTIWGGEFFCGDAAKMERVASLETALMPGGDKATQEPYRMGISYLLRAFEDEEELLKLPIPFVKKYQAQIPLMEKVMRNNPLLTSSCGRLFDAVSAILGICDIITYEAQAAVRLQRYAEHSLTHQAYGFDVLPDMTGITRICADRTIRELVADMSAGIDTDTCARKFHNGLAQVTSEVCVAIGRRTGIRQVCLSGGVFQNKLLLETLLGLLRKKKFTVFFNQLVPTNDGAVSLGQALIANKR